MVKRAEDYTVLEMPLYMAAQTKACIESSSQNASYTEKQKRAVAQFFTTFEQVMTNWSVRGALMRLAGVSLWMVTVPNDTSIRVKVNVDIRFNVYDDKEDDGDSEPQTRAQLKALKMAQIMTMLPEAEKEQRLRIVQYYEAWFDVLTAENVNKVLED